MTNVNASLSSDIRNETSQLAQVLKPVLEILASFCTDTDQDQIAPHFSKTGE